MRIISPLGEQITLDDTLSIEQRLVLVDELSEKYIDVIKDNWESNQVRFFLDGLGSYLVWYKTEEQKNKEDKEVISRTKQNEMIRGTHKYTPFSSATKQEKSELGLDANY